MKKPQMFVLIIVIVLVAGAVGYFVWQLQQRDGGSGAAQVNTNVGSQKNTNTQDSSFDFDVNAGVNTNADASGNVNESADATADDAAAVNVNAADETPAPAEGTAEFTDAQKRDQQRLADVESLQKALQAYFDAKQVYPDTLDGLVPDFIAALPKNPTPGGADYTYTPIGKLPATFYDLSYELEVGSGEVGAGVHTATPKGIAQP